MSIKKDIGVALVLGAGGVRGVAHVGILEVLEQHGIPIDLLVTCSVGSMFGTMYSYYGKCSILGDKLMGFKADDFLDISPWNYFKLVVNTKGLSQGHKIHKLLSHQLPNADLETLNIPVVVVATDISNFKPVAFSKGNIINTVLASCSFPPVFSPVEIDGNHYMDGAISSPLPADIARQFNPKIVIAANIAQHQTDFEAKNMLQITIKSLDIAHYYIAMHQAQYADVVIHPKIEVHGMQTTDVNDLYLKGKKEALKMLPKILKLLKKHNIPLKKMVTE